MSALDVGVTGVSSPVFCSFADGCVEISSSSTDDCCATCPFTITDEPAESTEDVVLAALHPVEVEVVGSTIEARVEFRETAGGGLGDESRWSSVSFSF